MKKILLILMSCGKPKQSINKEQLQERNGVYYEVNKETPYTGKVIAYDENGQIEYKVNYKNGQIKVKKNYKDGVMY